MHTCALWFVTLQGHYAGQCLGAASAVKPAVMGVTAQLRAAPILISDTRWQEGLLQRAVSGACICRSASIVCTLLGLVATSYSSRRLVFVGLAGLAALSKTAQPSRSEVRTDGTACSIHCVAYILLSLAFLTECT